MPKKIQPETLYRWVTDGVSSSNHKFAIIDVRDYDYEGGRIVGSWHYPADTFIDKMPELIERCKETNCKDVIFHCSFSQQRGPACATSFKNYVDSKESMKIYVLQGGFRGWYRLYGNDNTVTEPLYASQ